MKKLKKRVIKKCDKAKLFFTAIKDEDDRETIFDNCTMAQLERIDKVDLDIGYDENDKIDKMDFFNRLPDEVKRSFIINDYLDENG